MSSFHSSLCLLRLPAVGSSSVVLFVFSPAGSICRGRAGLLHHHTAGEAERDGDRHLWRPQDGHGLLSCRLRRRPRHDPGPWVHPEDLPRLLRCAEHIRQELSVWYTTTQRDWSDLARHVLRKYIYFLFLFRGISFESVILLVCSMYVSMTQFLRLCIVCQNSLTECFWNKNKLCFSGYHVCHYGNDPTRASCCQKKTLGHPSVILVRTQLSRAGPS